MDLTLTRQGKAAAGRHVRDRLGPLGRAVIATSRRLKEQPRIAPESIMPTILTGPALPPTTRADDRAGMTLSNGVQQ